MATCNGGCEYSALRLLVIFRILNCLAAYTINALLPGSSYMGPNSTNNGNSCKCSTVGYNLLSACSACQGGESTTYVRLRLRVSVCIGHTLIHNQAGRNTRTIAQRKCLHPRELATTEDWPGSDEALSCRFPNAVPSGTRVPQWALLDSTVRSPFRTYF